MGGHGQIAQLLISNLVDAGHQPVALIRKPEQSAALEAMGAETALLDIEADGGERFGEVFDGVDAVVFAAGGGADGNIERKRTVDLGGSLKSIAGAGLAGVKRFVQISAIGVDDDLGGPPELTAYKVRRGSGAIHLEDALTPEETARAISAGEAVAAEEIAAGAQLLISGDMGIGNTTPAAALIAASLGLPAAEVTGRGTGIDETALTAKIALVQQALDRAGDRVTDPFDTLTALGSADLAASAGFMAAAARAGLPVLLDGVISVAAAIMADRLAPGASAWFAAGHRSTEPAQSFALDKLGLEPILDLGLRLGEGSGAVAAVPIVRSAALVLRDVALLADLLPDA